MNKDRNPIGVIGLGAIGSAFCERLIAGGQPVVGFDVSSAAVARASTLGVEAAVSPAALAEPCRTVVTSLPHLQAPSDAVNGLDLVSAGGPLIDTHTFTPTHKAAYSGRLHHTSARRLGGKQ